MVLSHFRRLSLTPDHVTPIWSLLKELVVWGLSYLYIYIFAMVTLPFNLYRRLATTLVKLQDKKVTSVVTGLSALFQRDYDSLYTDKALHAIVACLRLKGGALSESRLQMHCLKRMVVKRDPDKGHYLYPELQQYFVNRWGYSFLKWDRHFDIKNHVRAYQGDAAKDMMVMTRSTLNILWEDLMVRPFTPGRSPWEVILVENYLAEEEEPEETAPDWVVFVRVHHSLADGFSLIRMVSSLFGEDNPADVGTVTPFVPKEPRGAAAAQQIRDLMENLRCLGMGPYDYVNRCVRYDQPYHSLHFPAVVKSNRYFIVESDLLPVVEVKLVKSRLGVGFTTVLLSVLCGAVQRYLEQQGLPKPERYTVTIPFPSRGQRGNDSKLGNEFYLTSVDLPLHLSSQEERLHQVQQNLETLRHSSFIKMADIIVKLLTNLPSAMLREFCRKSPFSATYSSIPGPDKPFMTHLDGDDNDPCTLIDGNFTHGLGADSLGVGISSIAYAGKIRMTLFIDRNLMGDARERAELLGECMMTEYRNLKTLSEGGQQ